MNRLKLGLFIILAATAFALSSCGSNVESELIGRWERVALVNPDGAVRTIENELVFDHITFFPNGVGSAGVVVRPGISVASVPNGITGIARALDWSLSNNMLIATAEVTGVQGNHTLEFSNNSNQLTLIRDDGFGTILERVFVSHDESVLPGRWRSSAINHNIDELSFEFCQSGIIVSDVVPGNSTVWSVSDEILTVKEGDTIIKEWHFDILHNDIVVLTYIDPQGYRPGEGYVLVREGSTETLLPAQEDSPAQPFDTPPPATP